MRNYLKTIFFISLFLGVVCFAIIASLNDLQGALLLGNFTFALSFIVFSTYMYFHMKRIDKIDLSDIDNISFKDTANFYKDRLIGNGILILTGERLIFIPTEKKKAPRIQFNMQEIKRASYDIAFKHIPGIKIELKDGSTIGLVTPKYNEVLELLNPANGQHIS
jgi:hypothetical protein